MFDEIADNGCYGASMRIWPHDGDLCACPIECPGPDRDDALWYRCREDPSGAQPWMVAASFQPRFIASPDAGIEALPSKGRMNVSGVAGQSTRPLRYVVA